jgi:hypothetical protein
MARCACSECIRDATAAGPSLCTVHAACACDDIECLAHAGFPNRPRALVQRLRELLRENRELRAQIAIDGSSGPTAEELIGGWSVEIHRTGGGRAWLLHRAEGEARELFGKAVSSLETKFAALRDTGAALVEEWVRR